jgi:hypothetical protein
MLQEECICLDISLFAMASEFSALADHGRFAASNLQNSGSQKKPITTNY